MSAVELQDRPDDEPDDIPPAPRSPEDIAIDRMRSRTQEELDKVTFSLKTSSSRTLLYRIDSSHDNDLAIARKSQDNDLDLLLALRPDLRSPLDG